MRINLSSLSNPEISFQETVLTNLENISETAKVKVFVVRDIQSLQAWLEIDSFLLENKDDLISIRHEPTNRQEVLHRTLRSTRMELVNGLKVIITYSTK